ncbi:MAG: hypothetical protein AAF602_12320 [Myxococcota bacterium]
MGMFVERLALLGTGRVLGPPGSEIRPNVNVAFSASVSRPSSRGVFRVDPSLSRTLEQIIESVGPAATRAANRYFIPLAERVVSQWPVATGLSRARFAVEVVPTPTGVRFTIVNTVPYADRIGGDSAVADEIIFRPADQVAGQMADEIAKGVG